MADALHTVIETEIYLRSAERLMTEAERAAVVDVIAATRSPAMCFPVRADCARCACLYPLVASVEAHG